MGYTELSDEIPALRPRSKTPYDLYILDRMETIADLQAFLRGLYPVPEPSTDHIIFGNPSAPIGKIGTCWQAYSSTIRKAAELKVNTLVVHEPVFYTHDELSGKNTAYGWQETANETYQRQILAKKALLIEHGISVIRSHDVPDSLPGFGIPFAWGRQLGFENGSLVRSKKYYNVYEIEPRKASEVAEQIAKRVKPIDQAGVAFWGDPDRIVRSVGVGTGCYCTPIAYMELGAEMYVAVDDTIRNWVETSFALDTGLPLVQVNHGTSEEAGVRELSAFLRTSLAPIEVIHLPQGCSYRWITG